ncbi:hypothetical protein HPB49_006469 [Dermacentor silvarum]|uniref:Uncharacterized protein n=1 Tax=Dermacentor silvarum TaxID=543639 RepID=A0ACB8CJS6_DERSI|nr:hypothetical protein HPB49_006469 [Dermacentor silvarum]
MMTPPISNELLISLVQFEPALWDQRSDMYRRNDARLNGWKRVVKALGLVVSQENINLIVRRWRNLRDTFGKKVKELRKKSGAGAGEPASKWKYFDMLLFLRDIVEPRPTTSNLDDCPNSLDEVLRESEDGPLELFSSMQPSFASNADNDLVMPHDNDTTHTRSSTPLSSILPHDPPPSSQPSLSPCSQTSTPQTVSTNTRTNTQTNRQHKRKSATDILMARVDSQLREEKLDRTEQFLLSLAEHMDNVPIRLRAQCKVHLLEVLMHYQAGQIPTMLSPGVGPLLRHHDAN